MTRHRKMMRSVYRKLVRRRVALVLSTVVLVSLIIAFSFQRSGTRSTSTYVSVTTYTAVTTRSVTSLTTSTSTAVSLTTSTVLSLATSTVFSLATSTIVTVITSSQTVTETLVQVEATYGTSSAPNSSQ